MSITSHRRAITVFGGVLFGGLIGLIGAIFVYALLVGYGRAKETRSWIETACMIVHSKVIETRPTPNSPMHYIAKVEYEYSFEGQEREGNLIKRVDGPSSYRKKAEQKVKLYPEGKNTKCWVNPADPDQAILEHGTLAPLYTIWFPGLFVIAGMGIVFNTLRRAIRASCPG